MKDLKEQESELISNNVVDVTVLLQQPQQFAHKVKRIYFEIAYVEKNKLKYYSLTSREKQIITLMVSGFNNPGISRKLFISRRTVEQHRKNINRKLGSNSLPEICLFAYAFDLV